MKIESTLTDQALLKLIGERMAQLRLARNLTQQQLADQAGLGVRTVQRLELGESATQLSSFVRVCRVLGIVERFDTLLPEPSASPMTQLAQLTQHKRAGHLRKRASGRKPATHAPGKWTWADTP